MNFGGAGQEEQTLDNKERARSSKNETRGRRLSRKNKLSWRRVRQKRHKFAPLPVASRVRAAPRCASRWTEVEATVPGETFAS